MPPRSEHPRAPRWRAHVAAVELVGAAVLAHASAEGGLPGPELMFPVVLVALGLTQAVRHHLLRPAAAAVLAGAAQTGLHLLFTAVPTGTSVHAAHHGSGHGAGHGAGHAVVDPSWLTGDMLLSHAVAAALTLLALLWQEQVVADLRRLLRPRDPRAQLPDLPLWLPHAAPRWTGPRSLVTTAPSRGPPLPGLATG